MFKMGCSMARRILAIDGRNSTNSGDLSSTANNLPSDQNSNPKKSKHKQQQGAGAGDSGAKKAAASGDDINDFSKLEADPRVPLNVRQIFKITKSWKAIARTMSKTGTAMFLNLFEQNEDLFYLFDRFQHLKGSDLHESMELKEHAATVMATLDQSINSLSDYDNFVTYLHSIGKLHRKVPGFRRAHFWKIEQPFLKAVKQTLDERCNESIEEIYKIAIKLIIETISVGYGEDDPANQPTSPKDSGSGNNNGDFSKKLEDKGDNFDENSQDKNNNKHSTTAANDNNINGRGGRQRQALAPASIPMDASEMVVGDGREFRVARDKGGDFEGLNRGEERLLCVERVKCDRGQRQQHPDEFKREVRVEESNLKAIVLLLAAYYNNNNSNSNCNSNNNNNNNRQQADLVVAQPPEVNLKGALFALSEFLKSAMKLARRDQEAS